MKYRIKFTKGEEIRFIGHLDVMRLFQRAVKRAGLPIAYSKGFNPHQLMGFANPLSLGMVSSAEYGDFEMQQEIEPKELTERLNEVLPEGVRVLLAVPLAEGAKKAMASVAAAKYLVVLPEDEQTEKIKQALPKFLNQKEIWKEKKTKKKQEKTDIRPDIYEVVYQEDKGEGAAVILLLAAGSIRNVKAELVMESLYEFAELPFPKYRLFYHRLELYQQKDGICLPLYEEGIEK